MSEELTGTELSLAQLKRIEKNKQRALILKNSRLVSHPYSKCDIVTKVDKKTLEIGNVRYKDTGGGFLLEEEVDIPQEQLVLKQKIPPIFEPDRPTCEECNKVFASSWLFDTFDFKMCDECKNPEIHKLITKTDALNNYLLKDSDLHRRDPPLKFITKKNPHNSGWGEMKLFLQIQVEKRALDIWGSEEKLQEEFERREEKRVEAKSKKYQKQMKQLRMNMRSSLYDRQTAASHTHEFGEETYNEKDDNYTHNCITCNYQETFEKM